MKQSVLLNDILASLYFNLFFLSREIFSGIIEIYPFLQYNTDYEDKPPPAFDLKC